MSVQLRDQNIKGKKKNTLRTNLFKLKINILLKNYLFNKLIWFISQNKYKIIFSGNKLDKYNKYIYIYIIIYFIKI